MGFPLEKILNISLGEYCANVDRKPNEYLLKGVHLAGSSIKKEPSLLSDFSEKVPEEAEVVICYTESIIIASGAEGISSARVNSYAHGVALILKNKEKKKPEGDYK